MGHLSPDLFPSILCLLNRHQLCQCSLVNSTMQHTAQVLLFSHFRFHHDQWTTQRQFFFLSSRGRALANHTRFLSIDLSLFNSQSLEYLSELVSLMQRVVSLKIDPGFTYKAQNWNEIAPGLWDNLLSKIGSDLRSMTVHAVSRIPLQDVLARCPSLRHLELLLLDSGYIAEEQWTTSNFSHSHFKSLSFVGYSDSHPGLDSFLQQTNHGLEVLHFEGYTPNGTSSSLHPLYSLRETLCHLSFDGHIRDTITQVPSPNLLPLSSLTRLQTLKLNAGLPGVGSLPPNMAENYEGKDEDYRFYIWISRLIQEEGLPRTFTTFRFSISLLQKPSKFIRHDELDNLATSTGDEVRLSFEFHSRGGTLGHQKEVNMVEQYLPTWKTLEKLRIRTVETYRYDMGETHWE
ncbi:hypothetical protein DL96DRAFT_1633670 [Flagelloscypha sp. PMI_526]|nr:hypothetical protein DL96DRAFT_1633670 [Flagelloscypha sp. PMI_526]